MRRLRDVVAQVLHDETSAQHYVIHEPSYDGEDMEVQQCIGGPDDHTEDALAVIGALRVAGYRFVYTGTETGDDK